MVQDGKEGREGREGQERVLWTKRSYAKVVLHLAKYPWCALNGLLLGRRDKDKEVLLVEDAIPLFHQCVHVSPMMEVALTQVDHVAQAAGLAIVGFYAASEKLTKPSRDSPVAVPPAPVPKVADKIAEYFPRAIYVENDNYNFKPEVGEAEFKILQLCDGKWKQKDPSLVCIDAEMKECAAVLICENAEKQLVDFDNHLDDLSRDWSNRTLNRLIDE